MLLGSRWDYDLPYPLRRAIPGLFPLEAGSRPGFARRHRLGRGGTACDPPPRGLLSPRTPAAAAPPPGSPGSRAIRAANWLPMRKMVLTVP